METTERRGVLATRRRLTYAAGLQWRLDKFDSKTLVLTRPFGGVDDGPVDDSFTFKERGRASAWCKALDKWYLWEPL